MPASWVLPSLLLSVLMDSADHLRTAFFTGEQPEAFCFLVTGVVSTLLALFFLGIIKYSFHKGLAYPLLGMGIFEIISSLHTILTRPSHQHHADSAAYYLSGLQTLADHLSFCRWIEAGALLSGLILYICFHKSAQTFWKGVGLGIIIHAVLWISLNESALYRTKKHIGQTSYSTLHKHLKNT